MIEIPGEAKAFALDTTPPIPNLDLVTRLQFAHDHRGAGYFDVVMGIARAAWSGRMSPLEYLMLELYDSRYDDAARETFIGAGFVAGFMKATGTAWGSFAEDKISMTALLRGYDLSIPSTQALFHTWRGFPGAPRLREASDIARFLREQATYPLFGKPVGAQLSLGTASIIAYDAERDVLSFPGGFELGVDAFVDQIVGMTHLAESSQRVLRPGAGYLFQSRLTPHPKVQEVIGAPATSTVRMVVVVDNEGPHLFRATWKLIGGHNVADNVWRKGNMAAALDIDTGAVLRVCRPRGEHLEFLEEHPDTGTEFDGLVFPCWDDLKATALEAAAAVPECPVQGWDIALSEQGPVVIELQAGGGSPSLSQMGYPTGLHQGRYKAVVEAIMERKKQKEQTQKQDRRAELQKLARELR